MTINGTLEGLPGQLYSRDTTLLLTVYLVFRLNLLDLKPCPWARGLIANAALWQLKRQAASWHIFMPYFYPKNDTIRNVWIPNFAQYLGNLVKAFSHSLLKGNSECWRLFFQNIQSRVFYTLVQEYSYIKLLEVLPKIIIIFYRINTKCIIVPLWEIKIGNKQKGYNFT